MGCDRAYPSAHRSRGDFNPRTRMGCDYPPTPASQCRPYFNPRTRMGCDFSSVQTLSNWLQFQSTHPHGVRRHKRRQSSCVPAISIHAPAWGATRMTIGWDLARRFQSTHPHGVRRQREIGGFWWRIFQSTHPHGVRPSRSAPPAFPHKFQSTHPHGVRLKVYSVFIGCGIISIHAPAWGATFSLHKPTIFLQISIHAPAWGATLRPD